MHPTDVKCYLFYMNNLKQAPAMTILKIRTGVDLHLLQTNQRKERSSINQKR